MADPEEGVLAPPPINVVTLYFVANFCTFCPFPPLKNEALDPPLLSTTPLNTKNLGSIPLVVTMCHHIAILLYFMFNLLPGPHSVYGKRAVRRVR